LGELSGKGGGQMEFYDLLNIRVSASPIGLAVLVLLVIFTAMRVKFYHKKRTRIKRSVKGDNRQR